MTGTQSPAPAEGIERLGEWWHPVKVGVEHAFGFSPDALHVLVGVGLQLVLARLLNTTVAHVFPWLGVLTLELLNEWSDLSFEIWPNRPMQWGESVKDVLLTMALPTLLLVISRWCPDLLGRADTLVAVPSKTRTNLGESVSEAGDDAISGTPASIQASRTWLRDADR